jgi:hypothetical protein
MTHSLTHKRLREVLDYDDGTLHLALLGKAAALLKRADRGASSAATSAIGHHDENR